MPPLPSDPAAWIAAIVPTALAVVLLAAVAVVGLRIARVAAPWAPLWAITRGALQLAALSVILAGLITNVFWVLGGLVVMLVAAVFVVARRVHARRREWMHIALAMALGITTALTIVFATTAIEFTPQYLLAIGGITIGNTMSIATLAGRHYGSLLHDRWDQVEGWLALGAKPVESTRTLTREAILAALIPSIDQTKTTGLVVLPGAFVGAVFAGASPLEAGRFQILVLASILAAGTIVAIVLLRLSSTVVIKPAAPAKG